MGGHTVLARFDAVEVRVDDPAIAAQVVAVLRNHNPRQLERRAA